MTDIVTKIKTETRLNLKLKQIDLEKTDIRTEITARIKRKIKTEMKLKL